MVSLGYLLSIVYGCLCLLSAFLFSKIGVRKQITRKLVHIFIGFEWVILYIFHGATIHFLVVCLGFLALLLFGYKSRILNMISSDGDNAPGTVYYAVSMSVMALISIFEPRFLLSFGVAVFVTSLGDGFAGLAGQLINKHNKVIYKGKTLLGVVVNFAFSGLSSAVFLLIFDEMGMTPLYCILVGLLSCGVELISERGLDNLTLPLSVSCFVYLLCSYPAFLDYVVPIIITPFVVAFVTKRRALTGSGIIAALVLDFSVSVSLGNFGFLLLLTFLVLGIFTDKLKKRSARNSEEKGACRDAQQVLANGLLPALSSLAYLATANMLFVFIYVATLAEALGDTAASSLGSHSNNTYDLFRLRRCERGLSGGVSVLGSISAVVFSAIIPFIALGFGMISTRELLFAVLIAFAGVFFDSLLGSLIQAKYRCSVCGKITERRVHCNAPTDLSSGCRIVTNEIVNAVSVLFVSIISAIFYLYII